MTVPHVCGDEPGVMSRRQPTSVRAEDTLFEGLCERLRQKRTRMTIHVAKNEADSMRIALDAQIMLRNHARRMIIGAAEFGRWNVVVPITAATIAKMHYAKVSTNYVTKKTVWDSKLAGEEISDEALGLRIHDALERTSAGFAQWIDDESRRNDRIFEIGERTRKAQGVAMELARAKVVDDPQDTRWEVGEDPYVIAEALEAGAHWIASGNFRTLKPQNMERWLDQVQAQGRFESVPRPFIIDPETAVTKMLRSEGPGQSQSDERALARGLAHAVSEPDDADASLGRRVAILTRFASELGDCGMSTAGQTLAEWCMSAAACIQHGKEQEVWDDIREMRRMVLTEEVKRTREAEKRRMRQEEGPARATGQQRARSKTSGGIYG